MTTDDTTEHARRIDEILLSIRPKDWDVHVWADGPTPGSVDIADRRRLVEVFLEALESVKATEASNLSDPLPWRIGETIAFAGKDYRVTGFENDGTVCIVQNRGHRPRNHGGWPPAKPLRKLKRGGPLRQGGIAAGGITVVIDPPGLSGQFQGGFPPPGAGTSIVQSNAHGLGEAGLVELALARRQQLRGWRR